MSFEDIYYLRINFFVTFLRRLQRSTSAIFLFFCVIQFKKKKVNMLLCAVIWCLQRAVCYKQRDTIPARHNVKIRLQCCSDGNERSVTGLTEVVKTLSEKETSFRKRTSSQRTAGHRCPPPAGLRYCMLTDGSYPSLIEMDNNNKNYTATFKNNELIISNSISAETCLTNLLHLQK